MPVPYPGEFRADVLRVVAARESGVTIPMIARDFGISAATVENWLWAQRIESGEKPGVTKAESGELRELRKRNRLLEHESVPKTVTRSRSRPVVWRGHCRFIHRFATSIGS